MNHVDRSPTYILCDYAAKTRFKDIPGEVVEMAKSCILDSIACSIGGSAVVRLPTAR